MFISCSFTGSCSKFVEADGEKCVPVIGHLAALIQHDTPVDVVLAAKNVILHNIQDVMTSNGHSSVAEHVVFVSEHGSRQQRLPPLDTSSLDHSYVDGSTKSSNNSSYLIAGTVIVGLAVLCAVGLALVVYKKKSKMNSCTDESDEKADTIGQTEQMSLEEQWDENLIEDTSGSDDHLFHENGDIYGEEWTSTADMHSNEDTPSYEDVQSNEDDANDSNEDMRSNEESNEDMHSPNGTLSESEGDNEPGFEHELNGGVNFVLINYSISDDSMDHVVT